MAKYDPLREHLRTRSADEFVMTWDEIEALVGPLPWSAHRPQWWANGYDLTHSQQRAWRGAGFDAFPTGSRTVTFRRRPERVAPRKGRPLSRVRAL